MAKLLPILAVFALCLNLFSGLLMTPAAAGTLGINPAVGGDQKVDQAQQQAGEFRSGAPTGSTLFGMYNVLSNVLSTLALPVAGLPNMLNRAGVPSQLTGMMKIVLSVVYALGTVSFLRGYSLNN